MQIGRNENASEKKKDKGALSYMKYLIIGSDREEYRYVASNGSKVIKDAKEREKIRREFNIDRLAEIAGIKPIGETTLGGNRYSSDFRRRVEEVIKEGKNDYINQKLEDWKTDLFKTVPRYFKISYNKERNLVEVTICSEAENIRTLFNQSSIKFEQRDIEEKVKKMVDLKLISDTPTRLQISEEDCLKFFAYPQAGKSQTVSFVTLREMIDKRIESGDIEQESPEENGTKKTNNDGDQQE